MLPDQIRQMWELWQHWMPHTFKLTQSCIKGALNFQTLIYQLCSLFGLTKAGDDVGNPSDIGWDDGYEGIDEHGYGGGSVGITFEGGSYLSDSIFSVIYLKILSKTVKRVLYTSTISKVMIKHLSWCSVKKSPNPGKGAKNHWSLKLWHWNWEVWHDTLFSFNSMFFSFHAKLFRSDAILLESSWTLKNNGCLSHLLM